MMPRNMHAPAAPATLPDTRRLAFYFGLVYFCQGVTQYTALLNQPLRNYLKAGLSYNAEQTAAFLFVAGLPWVIKPVYGLVSDFIPLLGYRRRSYLLIANIATAVAFFWMAGVREPRALMAAVFVVGLGAAMADVIVDALMVENGQLTGKVRLFQGIQWICISVASVGSGFLGATIISGRSPGAALGIAATIATVLPIVVAACTLWAVKEKRASLNVAEFKESAAGLWSAVKTFRLWVVLIFLSLLAANPGAWTAMYYHLGDVLLIPPETLAVSDAFFSIGNTLGAAVFLSFLSGKISLRKTMYIGIIVASVGMTPFFFVVGKQSAFAAYFGFGICYMIGNLCMLSLAAQACPKRAEGFVFAAIMSVLNLSASYSELLGGWLYEGPLAKQITPLIWLSIALTLVTLPFVHLVTPANGKSE